MSGAFLQGHEKQADRYVVPVDELADALGITRGQQARLRKARYGLVIAAKEWVESVYDGLKEMDFVQCMTDPCVWKPVKETSHGGLQLQVLVLFHIHDFMLAGRKGEASWEELQRRMHNKWKWSEWEQGPVRVTSVDVSQLQDVSFLMDQEASVDNIDPVEINPERRKTPEASVTEREKSTLRGLWETMQWPCTQTDSKRACAVSMLQSSLSEATVGTMMDFNRILKEMKSDLLEIPVHAHRGEKLAVLIWSDAAWANRKDLSSTFGFFSGVTTTRILQSGRHGMTPIQYRSGKSKRKARSNLSCTGKTPCVLAKRPHVLNMRAFRRYTRRRFECTHGGVLNLSTGGPLSLSSPSLFLSFLSFLPSSSCLSFVLFLLSLPSFSLFSSLFSLLSLSLLSSIFSLLSSLFSPLSLLSSLFSLFSLLSSLFSSSLFSLLFSSLLFSSLLFSSLLFSSLSSLLFSSRLFSSRLFSSLLFSSLSLLFSSLLFSQCKALTNQHGVQL